ncbi:MAG: PqqD family protein [Eubacteriales bacterium]|nr:PqqD family protein [Eubacteriales bacterium]
MKIDSDFALRSVAGTYVAVALGSAAKKFRGVINLNESGAMLFDMLRIGASKEQLVKALTDRYEVTEFRAADSVDRFVGKLKAASIL